MTRARLAVLLVPLVGSLAVRAQVPAAFEVASIKRNLSGQAGGSIQVPPAGTVRFTNVPLRVLIREAYEVDPFTERFRLISGPHVRTIGSAAAGWQPDVPKFDVQAKPPDNSLPQERRAMMRALLEDRFKLRVHTEVRQMPVYALTVLGSGRLGSSLAPSAFDCDAWLAQRRTGGTAVEPVDARGDSWCRYPIDRRRPDVANVRMAGPVRLLVRGLQPFLDAPLTDATGLTGNVEWMLTFASGPAASPDVPQIFTAVQEQLGLKLDTRRAPVAVLVVDSVELPTPD